MASENWGRNEVQIHFFEHHGRDGVEQHVGSVTFPDYTDWGEPQLTAQQMAARAWNLQCALKNLFINGYCLTAIGPHDPAPTDCQSGSTHERFDAFWVSYDALLKSLEDADGHIRWEPVPVSDFVLGSLPSSLLAHEARFCCVGPIDAKGTSNSPGREKHPAGSPPFVGVSPRQRSGT